jgi:hypothetical protein
VALKTELKQHLQDFPAPFLFVGAGISKRYLGLDSWEDLLRRHAEVAGQAYEYYAATADNDLPRIASLIAADLHEPWWKDDAFAPSREKYADRLSGPQSALKAEISMGLEHALDVLPTSGIEAEEVEMLGKAVVDGIITTNYDPLLEHLFPSFEVYVGQDQMLFSHPQGIGEIYKIHGSYEEPDSLVLTAEDYQTFNDRNPYLAAKLLTVFVEHPVIFLGYSLQDRNVTDVLTSIASVLTNERIQELQDRLVFIEWTDDGSESDLRAIPFVADGFTIPVLSAKVSDFTGVFEVLGSLERRLPARVLRQLKERVYELVQTNDPAGRLYVQDIDADVDSSDIDVVLGVGVREKLDQGYVGKTRNDLVDDLLDGGNLVPRRVVAEILPRIAKTTHTPIFKYLRGAGLLEEDGTLKAPASVDDRIVYRVNHVQEHFEPIAVYRKRAEKAVEETGRSFQKLVAERDPTEVLFSLGAIPIEKQSPNALRRFLRENRPDPDGDQSFQNLWYRGVCLYDWLRFSQAKPLGLKPPRRPKRKVRRRKKS